jgi:adenylylsulfate reductase subunit B
MSIQIDKEICNGCTRCVEACPGNLIKMVEIPGDRKAEMKYPKDCWGCTSCVKACPVQAIRFYLGADIGGLGSTVTVEETREMIHWKISGQDHVTKQIDIDRRNANKY